MTDAVHDRRASRIAPADLALGGVALVLPLLWSNRVYLFTTTPESAFLVVLVGPGLVALAALVARRDAAACAAAAFVVVAALATATAPEPLQALLGDYYARTGFWFLAACLGLWALGRLRGARATTAVSVGLVVAAVANAAVGWLQVSTDLGIEGLAANEGRARGLLGNPVFLGQMCAGAIWLVLDNERKRARPLVPLVVIGFLAGAVELSGSRIALAGAVLTAAWFAVDHVRGGRRLRAAAVLAAVVLGIVLALLPSRNEGSASSRLGSTEGSGSTAARISVLGAGVEAWTERPLLGWGPGRFAEGTTAHRSLESVRYEGADVLVGDAHDVFVELAVTTGLLGLATAALWVTLAARGARGALLGFAAIAGLSLLLEPLDLGTTPLLLLAFGVAGRAPPAATFSRGARRAALASGALLALVGVVIGARAIAGDTAYAHAVARYSIADVRRADELSPPWPQFPGLEAQLVNLRGMAQRDPALGRRAVGLARRAVDRDPGDPRWWYLLAAIRSVQGDRAGATRDYQAALRRNPWSASALRGLYEIARRDGDEAAARQYREKLCRIGPMQCPVNVRGSRSRSSGP